MSTPRYAVHLGKDGGPSCGAPRATHALTMTTDLTAVTCGRCLTGWQWPDVKPHGTTAALRRHYRQGTRVCESCRQADSRDHADRNAARRVAA